MPVHNFALFLQQWLNMSKSEKNYTKCKGYRQMKCALRQNILMIEIFLMTKP